jgi:hypothetical protein
MTSSRLPGSPMLTWLQADLESTTQDWIIAFWHHPPYTKGSHNSDTEIELVEMRQHVLPVLEAGGVDLVLTGHSHSYERSYLINGHYGLSTTFSSSNLIDNGNGRDGAAGTGSYAKPAGLAANQGAVYIVAGNGGHVTSWVDGSAAEFSPNPHPAMFYSALHVGSLVLDIDGGRLDARMIRETGAIDDYFSIVKNLPNTPPQVTMAAPISGATFVAGAHVAVSASAVDQDGSITQVDYYANNGLIGSSTTAPFAITWNDVPAGHFLLTAAATDSGGATTSSAAVTINVTPAAPQALMAVSGNAGILLAWNATDGAAGYTVKRATSSGGPYTTLASGLTSRTYTDVAPATGVTYFYVVSASSAGGESANSNQATATQPAPTLPAKPSNLIAKSFFRTMVNLVWNDNADNETGYVIERSSNGRVFTPIAKVGAGVRRFANVGLTGDRRYYYRVRAVNAVGSSAFSNIASVKTPK